MEVSKSSKLPAASSSKRQMPWQGSKQKETKDAPPLERIGRLTGGAERQRKECQQRVMRQRERQNDQTHRAHRQRHQKVPVHVACSARNRSCWDNVIDYLQMEA